MAAMICNIIDKSDTDGKVSKNKSDSRMNNQKQAKKINTSHYNNVSKFDFYELIPTICILKQFL